MIRSVRNVSILLALVLGLLGFVATPFDPYGQGFLDGWPHLLGVDEFGQDVLSRVWRGAANSLWYGGVSSLGVFVVSTVLLLAERNLGDAVGRLIRSAVSLGIAMPILFVGLLFIVFMEREPATLVWAISLAGSPYAFRQLRVLWLEQSAAQHVVASRAIGGGRWHVFKFSILPNLIPQLVELWKVVLAVSVLELSALTFLGLAGDPNWAELGSILRAHQKHLFAQPMLVVWPGLALSGFLWLVRLVKVES